jgi:hypothetical protein
LNGTPAMYLEHMNVALKWCICMLMVDWGIGMIITVITKDLSVCLLWVSKTQPIHRTKLMM